MNKTKIELVGFLVGFLGFQLLTQYLEIKELKAEVQKWETQWEGTRDAWLEDRRSWRDGKKFEYNYGPHGARW